MKPLDKILLFFARTGMELTWLYAWANFMSVSTMNRSFPLPATIAAFLLAVLVCQTQWISGKGWRIILISVFHLLGFMLASAMILFIYTDGTIPFLKSAWVSYFFQLERSSMEWIILVLVFSMIIIIWISGVTFARRPGTYTSACRRFDLGATALFSLFLLKLLIIYKGGTFVHEPVSELMIFPFFIFAVLALGIINRGSDAEKSFLGGFQGVGLILSLAVVGVGFSAAVALLLLPLLTVTADTGYAAVKTAAEPLGRLIESILLLLFSGRKLSPSPGSGGAEKNNILIEDIPDPSGWMVWFQEILMWSLICFIGLVIIVLVCIGVWYLARWLWYKYKQIPYHEGRAISLGPFLQWIARWVKKMGTMLLELFAGYTTAVQLYDALARWGRRSGIVRSIGDTPNEYGRRLGSIFPILDNDIRSIIEAYHREVYAPSPLGNKYFINARHSWRRLRSPTLWLARLKSKVLSNAV